MWKNNIYSILFLAVALSSCKKEVENWDKEANLVTDTSTYIHSVTYVSHVGGEAIFDYDIVQFNHLESNLSYTSKFVDEHYLTNYNVSAVSQTTHTISPISDYSSLFLFEKNGYELYYEGEASFYLRRYFEFVEEDGSNKRIGMATFLADENGSIEFFKQNGTLFNNTANYNDSILVDLIHKSELYLGSYDPIGNSFIQIMFEAIDELATNPDATGQKSITLFDNYENNDYLNYPRSAIDSIATKAIANNVHINVVSIRGTGYARMAFQTGGFFIDLREINQRVFYAESYHLSSIGNNIANLDRILRHDVTAHRVRLKIEKYGGSIFYSGEVIDFDFAYGDDVFRHELKIP